MPNPNARILAALLALACACGGRESGPAAHDAVEVSAVEAVEQVSPGDTAPELTGLCGNGEACPGDKPHCDSTTGTCVQCRKDDHCGGALPFCHPSQLACVECVMADQCGDGLNCLDGDCTDRACWPGSVWCVGTTVHACSPDGMDPDWDLQDCGEQVCHQGACVECLPDQVQCKGKYVVDCDAAGTSYQVQEDCGDLQCIGGQCWFCYPGERRCDGAVAQVCDVSGAAWDVAEDCGDLGMVCAGGKCLSPCSPDVKLNTNAGCEFYAVDLHNAVAANPQGGAPLDAHNAQFALIVSNTSETQAAQVTITRPDGLSEAAQLPALSLHKFLLPPTWGIDGTQQASKAFRVESSQPVTVYQFNPLSNLGVFSNDASVLLPGPNLGTEYYVASWQRTGQYKSNFVLVGVREEPVVATVTVTTRTAAGPGLPGLEAGESWNVQVARGDVVAFEAADNWGEGDLTGSHIVADGPLAVFGAHTAAATGERCCADHLEQQLLPVSRWGTRYLMTRSWFRWMEHDHVRIVAARDDTQVVMTPAIAEIPLLQAGEHYTFLLTADVEIEAVDPETPIQVVQYLASSHEVLGPAYTGYGDAEACATNADCPPQYTCMANPDHPGVSPSHYCVPPACWDVYGCPPGHVCEAVDFGGVCAPIGDPAMILSVPEAQFVESYIFLTPDAYEKDYLNVIAPLDAGVVELDGAPLDLATFQGIGVSGFGVYRTALFDGIHRIHSDRPIGIVVYGYDDDVSYGYPGGTGMNEIGASGP
jgi:hypothetical protein